MSRRLAVGLIISAVLLWLAVRQVKVAEFGASLTGVELLPAAVAFLLTVLVCLLRALRWRLLFSPLKKMAISDLLSVIMVGFLGNNLLPARLGDVAMVYLVDHRQHISKSRAASVILLDRLLDVATLVVVLMVSLWVAPAPDWVRQLAWSGVALTLITALVLGLLVTRDELCRRCFGYLTVVLPAAVSAAVMGVFGKFVDGLQVLRSPLIMVAVALLSGLIWVCLASGVYLLFIGFGFPLAWPAALAVLAIVNLGLIVPSSPGFVGTFQFFCVAALALQGIDSSAALGFSVVYHLSQWLPTTLLGFYFLHRENLSFGRLTSIEAESR